jgi:acyl-CoA reductase-like NAD-dependent aldehyde dehydrogenase
VFDDADIDRVVRDALEGDYFNKGEGCTPATWNECFRWPAGLRLE